MIDSAMFRRILTQLDMPHAIITDDALVIARAIYAEGVREGREECARMCEQAGAAMAWPLAKMIRDRNINTSAEASTESCAVAAHRRPPRKENLDEV